MSPKRALAILALVAGLSTAASAQTVAFNLTGTASGKTVSGSGTLTPGGATTFTAAVRDSGNDSCDESFQLVLTVNLSNGDALNLLFESTTQSQSGGSQNINGTLLALPGSKGSFANLGGTGTLAIVATQNPNNTLSVTATGSITMGGPVTTKANIFPGGSTNLYSDTIRLSPGSWASIFGENLATTTATWNGDFPTALGNVTGKLDGKDLYFWFVSPGQINFQVPDGTKTGCVALTLNTPNGTVTRPVEVQGASPSFLMLDDKYITAIILTPNGTGAYGGGTYDIAGPVGRFAYKTRPVKRGESLVVYAEGFGPTNPLVPAGKAFSGAARSTLTWNFGLSTSPTTGVPLTASFVGLVSAGLYQINLTIPQNAPLGDYPIKAFLQGVTNGPITQDYPTLISIGQ